MTHTQQKLECTVKIAVKRVGELKDSSDKTQAQGTQSLQTGLVPSVGERMLRVELGHSGNKLLSDEILN